VTVVLPEFIPARWWHQLLHNQSSLLLKGSLLFKKRVVVRFGAGGVGDRIVLAAFGAGFTSGAVYLRWAIGA